MIALLVEEPILLLLVVAAISYPIGRLKIGGATLGLAAVLFVGLAFGALDPRLELPEFIYIFGLVLFVYTVGLTSGRGLVASLRRETLPAEGTDSDDIGYSVITGRNGLGRLSMIPMNDAEHDRDEQ